MDKRAVYPIYTVKDLLEMEDDPDLWLVRNIIPKAGRILIYGTGGSYKSALMFDLAVAIASGGMLIEQLPLDSFGAALVLSTEGTKTTMRRRLLGHMRSRNVVPDAVRLFFGRKPLFLDKPEEMAVFRQLIRTFNPAYTLVDPYASFMSANENDTEETKKLTRHLDEIVEEENTCIAIIHHANKANELRGSTVLQGWADTVLRSSVKRRQQVPGLDGLHDIITLDIEKQRDGPMGTAFSAVPFINTNLGMISFGIYHGMDAKMVQAVKLKHDILELMRKTRGIFTKTDLCTHFNAGRERMGIALAWLARDGLIVESHVPRSTGDGRYRNITGWGLASIGSRVDAASAIFRAAQELEDAEPGELC